MWRGEKILDLLECFGSIIIPLELIGLPEKFKEGKAFIAEPTDESAQCGHASGELHHILFTPGCLHESDGVNLSWVSLYSSIAYDKAE